MQWTSQVLNCISYLAFGRPIEDLYMRAALTKLLVVSYLCQNLNQQEYLQKSDNSDFTQTKKFDKLVDLFRFVEVREKHGPYTLFIFL